MHWMQSVGYLCDIWVHMVSAKWAWALLSKLEAWISHRRCKIWLLRVAWMRAIILWEKVGYAQLRDHPHCSPDPNSYLRVSALKKVEKGPQWEATWLTPGQDHSAFSEKWESYRKNGFWCQNSKLSLRSPSHLEAQLARWRCPGSNCGTPTLVKQELPPRRALQL